MGRIKMFGRCPVCGHGKGEFYATRGQQCWCTYYEDDSDGGRKIYCMRVASQIGVPEYGTRFTGASGEDFIFLCEDKKQAGCIVIKEEDLKGRYLTQAENRQSDYVMWCRNNGKKATKDYVRDFLESWANGTFFKERADKFGKSGTTTNQKPRVEIHDAVHDEYSDTECPILNRKQLDILYRTLLEHLSLSDYDRNYLLHEGWTDEMIKKSMIRSFPEDDWLRFKYKTHKTDAHTRHSLARLVMEDCLMDNLEGLPGAGIDKKGNWTFTGPAGLLIPMYDADGFMYRVRLRRNFSDVDGEIHHDNLGRWYIREDGAKIQFSHKGLFLVKPDGTKENITEGGKYRNFSSNWMNKGTQANNSVGFYGNPNTDDPVVAYVTEGEKKAMYANFRLGAICISLPGVSSFGKLLERDSETGKCPAESLLEHGIRFLVVAYDADKAINANVLRMEENLLNCETLKEMGFYMAKAEWDINLGKGIDDCLANNGRISYEI